MIGSSLSSRSPLVFTRFFLPCSDIFKLWSMYLLKIIHSLSTDPHSSAASNRLNWPPRWFKWTHPFLWKTKSGFCACAITFQTIYTTDFLCTRSQRIDGTTRGCSHQFSQNIASTHQSGRSSHGVRTVTTVYFLKKSCIRWFPPNHHSPDWLSQ
jgi:hypothetical protein